MRIGGDPQVSEVEIRWPSGTIEFWHNLAANQYHAITENRFSIAGPLTPGSQNSLAATFQGDGNLAYGSALVAVPDSEVYLPDGRAIRIDTTDPLFALSIAPGNTTFLMSAGALSAGNATMTLNIPSFPGFTGFGLWAVAVTVDPVYPGGVKSILGPQQFFIQ